MSYLNISHDLNYDILYNLLLEAKMQWNTFKEFWCIGFSFMYITYPCVFFFSFQFVMNNGSNQDNVRSRIHFREWKTWNPLGLWDLYGSHDPSKKKNQIYWIQGRGKNMCKISLSTRKNAIKQKSCLILITNDLLKSCIFQILILRLIVPKNFLKKQSLQKVLTWFTKTIRQELFQSLNLISNINSIFLCQK